MVLMALTGCFFVAMPQMCMPVLFTEISEDLGLNQVQVGWIWSMLPLAGLFVTLPGGMLADRFGTKKVLVIGCFLTGIAGILRGFADSFSSLTVGMFVFGILQIMTAPALVRASSLWFSGKHLGLSNGVLSMSMGFGFLLSSMISATVLSPLLGGWRNVLIAYGVVSIVICVLWIFTRNTPEQHEMETVETETVSFRESITRVAKIKQIWILGIVMVLYAGCVQGMLGYLPYYLKSVGWNPATADGALATFHGLSTIFTVAIVLISGKIGSRKKVLFLTLAFTALGVGILIFTSGGGVWAAMIIAGMVRDGFMATHMTMLLETKGVGVKYAGTAIGLAQTVAKIGEIGSPPLGNSLAETNPAYAFIMWSSLAALGLVAVFFLKEKGKDRLPVE